ncbi:Fe-S cluster assembly protein SufB [Candidatus Woesearchaeota archaeon]|nr:Fe-S cluster assembly protein SufB [Candidatus Woesearchaeota archaeon]
MNEIKELSTELYEKSDIVGTKFETIKGLNEDVVRQISEYKKEPEWMLNLRLQSLKIFQELEMPKWGPDISDLNLSKITYFNDPESVSSKSWDDVPENIKRTFDALGIPEAEKKALAGVGAQFDSSTVYHNLAKELEEKGVIFKDMDEAVKDHPQLIQKYFMKQCISPSLHKFAALHGAVWSGGTFIYVPKNVDVGQPLQAYFRMNKIAFGQFEHTLIILEEGAKLHYIEGCSAPKYDENSLHAGGVEIFVHKNANMRYSSVENWSKNTYNLNTKRALVYEDANMEWVSGNMGSKKTMLYPATILIGKGSSSTHIGVAYASKDQEQDTGAKVYHMASNTTSIIKNKSISREGGITNYRGIVKVARNAENCSSAVDCDALMLDNKSQSNTFPTMDINNKNVTIAHEARVGKISDDQIFYLQSRGIPEEQAMQMIVNGFMEPLVKELPLEYASEMNKLIELDMEGSLG